MEKSNFLNFNGNNANDCWQIYQKVLEETKTLDVYLGEECDSFNFYGEQEAEWLQVAGLGELAKFWQEGREIQPDELDSVLSSLSHSQAEVVKRRVYSLNQTIKQCYNHRQKVRKPDIRDVFKDVEVSSAGTRSRSATPDSLDSISEERSVSISPLSLSDITVITSPNKSSNIPNFISIFNQHENKEEVERSPHTVSGIPSTTLNLNSTSLSIQEIFRRTIHGVHRDDLPAEDSEGIKLTAYHRLGTLHFSQPTIQKLNGTDSGERLNADCKCREKSNFSKNSSLRRNGIHTTITRSHSRLCSLSISEEENIKQSLNRTYSHKHLGFEEMCKSEETENKDWVSKDLILNIGYLQEIELLSQRDITRLQPLLWLELTSIFDKYNIPLIKRKPNKRRIKSGNLFGVSLSTLLLRDNYLTNKESNIPLVFQKIFYELLNRGVNEEGILRIGGHKQKVETLCTELETDFYSKPDVINQIFKHIPCHDLSIVLKKLLRDLPQPLLTIELIDAFYQTHGIKNSTDLFSSLNLLILLLPIEHRSTLKALLNFLKLVIKNQNSNKMSIHNVAMIIAPSLFPPHYIYPKSETNLTAQINIAAMCCQVTEAILINFERLWYVSNELINQLQRQAKEEKYRKFKKNH